MPVLQYYISEGVTVNLNEIREKASVAANSFDFNWDKIDTDPMERQYLENQLNPYKNSAVLKELESIHTKLTSGKSVVMPDEDTAIPYDEVETYIQAVEEELFSGYILQELQIRYDLIRSVTKLVSE